MPANKTLVVEIRDFELKMMEVEERLRPIANRPVDITRPGWGTRLAEAMDPLDEAGVRHQTDLLLWQLIQFYQKSDHAERNEVRNLFKKFHAFTWAAHLSFGATTEEKFRQHVLLFSMKDQGRDSRDALLWLQHLCREAKSAGVNCESMIKEVAELSSDQNKYGMGSTKQMLLKAI